VRAALVKEFGPPSTLVVEEVEDPVAGPCEVVIGVAAASVNFPDLLVVDGSYQILPDRPFSPGKEAAGTVLSVGEGVTRIKTGDRVLALMEFGGYAEKLKVAEDLVIPLPDSVGFPEAAAFGLVYLTAWFGLVRRAAIKAGDTVLVTGAGGGVGSAGVQLAKALGATVIALAKDNDRAELARSQGADHVLTSGADTLRDDLMALTGGRGVDITLEMLGGEVLTQVIRATAWEGRVVIVGFASGRQAPVKPGHLLVKNISLIGLQASDYRDRTPKEMRAATQTMLELVVSGQLDPQIHRTYPLDEAAAALEHVGQGKVRGKIVIVTGQSN
jgi:NADPH2:quinone reductase